MTASKLPNKWSENDTGGDVSPSKRFENMKKESLNTGKEIGSLAIKKGGTVHSVLPPYVSPPRDVDPVHEVQMAKRTDQHLVRDQLREKLARQDGKSPKFVPLPPGQRTRRGSLDSRMSSESQTRLSASSPVSPAQSSASRRKFSNLFKSQ